MESREMATVEIEPATAPAAAQDGEITAQKSAIGIIYPPPEVRNIVDKTAIFVARNGPVFEEKIRQNEINNPKFNFLNPNDPYHNYYKHKVKEVIEGKVPIEPAVSLKPALSSVIQKPAQEQQFKLPETIVLKDPPPEPEFIIDPPSISAYDLDVVKVTAQFVARNGRQFLNNLMNRESRNFQFDFLRPQHSLFNYFTKLVEQYTKILLPSKDMLVKLQKQAEDPKNLFDEVMYKIEWVKHQEREKKKEEDEKEKERVAYAQIDWHKFVVVETLELFESGNLPPPTAPEEVGSRLIALERYQQHGEMEVEEPEPSAPKEAVVNDAPKSKYDDEAPSRGADTRVQDMEEDSDSEEEDNQPGKIDLRPPPLPKEAPQMLNTEHIIIRSDYDPKANRQINIAPPSDVSLTSPFTNEKVPANQIQEHIRIGLLDPRWIEQRDRAIQDRREQEEVYAHGSSIGNNLRQLAERRSDIFGSATEETQIGRKIGEEEKKEKVKEVWDGHSTSSEKICQKARENITIEDQIAVIHKTKGLLHDEEKEKIGPAMPKHSQPTTQIHPNSATVICPAQPPSITSTPAPPVLRPPVIPTQPVVRPMVAPMTPARPLGIMAQLPILMGQPAGQPGVMPQISMGRPPFMPGAGLIPGLQGHMIPTMQAPHQMQGPDGMDDEPAYKRAKLEESLIPEHEYLARNPNPVEFKIQLPMIDKSEWKLNGQMFPVALPLSDTVSVIKAKIFDEVGMPAGKQKLQLDGMFLKDSNTLAYYNFNPSTIVLLQLKERGGRKK